MGSARWSLSIRQMLVVIAVCALVSAGFAWLFGNVDRARKAARASQCICNLCSIKMAILNYHESHGCFPPAYLADAQGRPAHSWRVLILPFMDQQALYASYNFGEPWNGPNNARLAGRMPTVYSCPNHRQALGNTLTDYVAVTGPGTIFPGAKSTGLTDIKDGAANTVTVVEAANLNVPWTAPVDLDVRTMSFRINDPTRPGLSSYDPGGPAVVTADGRYHRLDAGTPPRFVKAILTLAGDEPVDWNDRR